VELEDDDESWSALRWSLWWRGHVKMEASLQGVYYVSWHTQWI
jgi:hypothetical protein